MNKDVLIAMISVMAQGNDMAILKRVAHLVGELTMLMNTPPFLVGELTIRTAQAKANLEEAKALGEDTRSLLAELEEAVGDDSQMDSFLWDQGITNQLLEVVHRVGALRRKCDRSKRLRQELETQLPKA